MDLKKLAIYLLNKTSTALQVIKINKILDKDSTFQVQIQQNDTFYKINLHDHNHYLKDCFPLTSFIHNK